MVVFKPTLFKWLCELILRRPPYKFLELFVRWRYSWLAGLLFLIYTKMILGVLEGIVILSIYQ